MSIEEEISPVTNFINEPKPGAFDDWHPMDHVSMVRNALEAVRCLAMSSTGTGHNDNLHLLNKNHLADLLEIINDRLVMALEQHELREA